MFLNNISLSPSYIFEFGNSTKRITYCLNTLFLRTGCIFNLRQLKVIIEEFSDSPSLSVARAWWSHTPGSLHSCPASAFSGWQPAARSRMPPDDRSCSRYSLPEPAPQEIRPGKHNQLLSMSDLKSISLTFWWMSLLNLLRTSIQFSCQWKKYEARILDFPLRIQWCHAEV